MVKEFCEVLNEKYDENTQTVEFPSVLNNKLSADAEFEIVSSNTLQKLRIVREFNIVKKSIAIIFANTTLKDLKYE